MARLVLRMAALAALFLIAVSALPSSARARPDVTINSVSYSGTGCRSGNTDFLLSEDANNDTLSFILRGMSTSIKGGFANDSKEKFCFISFDLSYPDGWSYTVRHASGRAFVDVGIDSKVAIKSEYYFSGQRGTASMETVHDGPLRSTLPFNNTFPEGLWSECNTTPNVNTKTTVRVQGLKAKISDVRVFFDFDWRTC